MTILLAPDSFKDALSAMEVCRALEQGVRRALPAANVRLFPMADGGEGTAEVLAWHLRGELVEVEVNDPIFRRVKAKYFRMGKMAFIEMAQASGLQLLELKERNPLKTSTFGTGELVMDAMRHGVEEIYLAVGGSATNDAGMGMAAALGWHFLDGKGEHLLPIGENLGKVESLVPPNPKPETRSVKLLCDVTNPLYGPQGAATIFAKQKGADEAAIVRLDKGLRHFSGVVERHVGADFSAMPGAGAAGGLGFGAMAFLGASVSSGAVAIMQLTGFEEAVQQSDLIITGEGRLDGQTAQGKLVSAICKVAKLSGVPVMAICGEVDADDAALAEIGLKAAYQIRRPDETLLASIARTPKALETLAYKVLKTIRL